jgi:hypothetical protein
MHPSSLSANWERFHGFDNVLKLEQFVALVVAAGLAIVSYMLFFSWAGGGGYQPRQPRRDEMSRLGWSASSLTASLPIATSPLSDQDQGHS